MINHLLASIAIAPVDGGVLAAMLAVAVSAARPKPPEPEKPPTPLLEQEKERPCIRMIDDTGKATIIAAVFGAIGAIGAALAPKLFGNKPKKDDEEKFVEGLSGVGNLIKRLAEMEEHGAERVILFRAHNSGGFPSPGLPFYVSASQWVPTKRDSEDQIGNYRNVMVDGEYIKMLLSAWGSEQRYTYLVTEQMPACQLRRYYDAEGVLCSAVFMLGIHSRAMFYISAAKYKDEFSEQDLTQMSLIANSIWQDMIGAEK